MDVVVRKGTFLCFAILIPQMLLQTLLSQTNVQKALNRQKLKIEARTVDSDQTNFLLLKTSTSIVILLELFCAFYCSIRITLHKLEKDICPFTIISHVVGETIKKKSYLNPFKLQ